MYKNTLTSSDESIPNFTNLDSCKIDYQCLIWIPKSLWNLNAESVLEKANWEHNDVNVLIFTNILLRLNF